MISVGEGYSANCAIGADYKFFLIPPLFPQFKNQLCLRKTAIGIVEKKYRCLQPWL